jgi:hypothetical protein
MSPTMTPSDLARLRDEANDLLNRGQYKKSYERYQQLQAAEPDNPEWASRVGELAVSLGDVEIAAWASWQSRWATSRSPWPPMPRPPSSMAVPGST